MQYFLALIWGLFITLSFNQPSLATMQRDASSHAAETHLQITIELSYWLDVKHQTVANSSNIDMLNTLNSVQFNPVETDQFLTKKLSFGWTDYPVWIKIKMLNPHKVAVDLPLIMHLWLPESLNIFQYFEHQNLLKPMLHEENEFFLSKSFNHSLPPKTNSTFFVAIRSQHPINFYLTQSKTDLFSSYPLNGLKNDLDQRTQGPYKYANIILMGMIALLGITALVWSLKADILQIHRNTLVQQRLSFALYSILMLTLSTEVINIKPWLVSIMVIDHWIATFIFLLYITGYRHLHQQANNAIFQTQKSKWGLHSIITILFSLSFSNNSLALGLLLAAVPTLLIFWMSHLNYHYFKNTKNIDKNLLNPMNQYLSVIVFSVLSVIQCGLFWQGGLTTFDQNSLFQLTHIAGFIIVVIWQWIVMNKINKNKHQLGLLKDLDQEQLPSDPHSISNFSKKIQHQLKKTESNYIATISSTHQKKQFPPLLDRALLEKLELQKVDFNLRTLGQDILKAIDSFARLAQTPLLYSIKPGTITHLKGNPQAIEFIINTLVRHSLSKSTNPFNALTIRLETEVITDNHLQLICSLKDKTPSDPDFNNALNHFMNHDKPLTQSQSDLFSLNIFSLLSLKELLSRLDGKLLVSSQFPLGTHYQLMLPVNKKIKDETDHREVFSYLRDKTALLTTYNGEYGAIMSEQANSLDIPLSLALSNEQAFQNLKHTHNTQSKFDLILIDYSDPPRLIRNFLTEISTLPGYQNTPILLLVPTCYRQSSFAFAELKWPILALEKPASFAQLATLMTQILQAPELLKHQHKAFLSSRSVYSKQENHQQKDQSKIVKRQKKDVSLMR